MTKTNLALLNISQTSIKPPPQWISVKSSVKIQDTCRIQNARRQSLLALMAAVHWNTLLGEPPVRTVHRNCWWSFQFGQVEMPIPKEIYSLFPPLDFSYFFFAKRTSPKRCRIALRIKHLHIFVQPSYGIIEECHLLNHSTSSVSEVVLFQNFEAMRIRVLTFRWNILLSAFWVTAIVTTRVFTFFVGDPELNLHLPLLLMQEILHHLACIKPCK